MPKIKIGLLALEVFHHVFHCVFFISIKTDGYSDNACNNYVGVERAHFWAPHDLSICAHCPVQPLSRVCHVSFGPKVLIYGGYMTWASWGATQGQIIHSNIDTTIARTGQATPLKAYCTYTYIQSVPIPYSFNAINMYCPQHNTHE